MSEKDLITWRELKKLISKLKEKDLDSPVKVIFDRKTILKKGQKVGFKKSWFYEK